VLAFLLVFRFIVLVEELLGEVPRTEGTGAGVGVGAGGVGDKDSVLLKLTFSEFSVNCIDCLFWLLVRIVQTGGVEGREVGGAIGFGLAPVPSDTDFRSMESTVADFAC
jgi:hypothetical protein